VNFVWFKLGSVFKVTLTLLNLKRKEKQIYKKEVLQLSASGET